MAEFTFFELHLDDATITNNAPYSGADPPKVEGDGTDDGRSLLPLVVGVVVLMLAVLAVVRMRGSGQDDEDERL